MDNKLKYMAFLSSFVAVSASACVDRGLPGDVFTFLEKRNICDDLRGELSDQPSKDEILNINVAFEGTDRQLETLRKKYQKRPDVMNRLTGYETNIKPQ